jgi:hypothetical protein
MQDQNKELKIRVRLEPELEQIAGGLDAVSRKRVARKFKRWAHQLEVSAIILIRDAAPRPRPVLRRLSPRRLRLN